MKEKTVINGLIDHSKAIHKYKMFLEMIRRFTFVLSRVPDTLPSENKVKEYINNVELESRRRISERNNACKKYLLPLLNGKAYGFITNFYFSPSQLRDGYVFLHEQLNSKIPNKVLFLNNYEKIKEGDIIDYEECKEILIEVKPVIKPGDLIIKHLAFPPKPIQKQ